MWKPGHSQRWYHAWPGRPRVIAKGLPAIGNKDIEVAVADDEDYICAITL